MLGPSLTTDAFILAKRPPTDAFQTLIAFSAAAGVLTLRCRLPGKREAPAPAIDLFDEVSCVLAAAPQGSAWFVREIRLLTRYAEIGRSYPALVGASRLAALIARNAPAIESRPRVEQQLRQALEAFASSSQPEIVYFKSLYRFARDEGYPVRQEWIPSLPDAWQAEARRWLRTPLAELAQAPLPPELAAKLTQRLEAYLRAHTEILFD